MIVLSLFDGISCGRLALERSGIKVTKYYASEIDKYAIQISKKNYPDIIQLGDVNQWISWDIDYPDLLIGGSPCQGFSFAGKQLAFNDSRSILFWQFVALLIFCKPKYFLLENVRMKKEHLNVITNALGVEPILINSALVSAQNRLRYYWTNIPNVTQPEDKRIVLADILENVGTGWIKNENQYYLRNNKSMCLDANYHKGADNHGQRTVIKQLARGYNKGFEKEVTKSPSITSSSWQDNNFIKCGSMIGRKIDPETKKRIDHSEIIPQQRIELRLDNKTGTLTTVQKDNLVIKDSYYRKLTPIECERLQTVPDNYTEGVSNTQRYKMLGNAWTVDIIAHIFKGIQNHE